MKWIYYCFLYFICIIRLGSGLFLWEPRTLKCEKSACFLSKTTDEKDLKPATCNTQASGEYMCDIECDGAERDSVISKKPTDYRYCNRFFTYNTRHTDGKWYIWRNGTCAQANITMIVHCAFPFSGQ